MGEWTDLLEYDFFYRILKTISLQTKKQNKRMQDGQRKGA